MSNQPHAPACYFARPDAVTVPEQSALLLPVRKLSVGVDLDGVNYDFVAALRDYLVEHRGYAAADLPDARRWTFYEDWGLTLTEFLEVFNAAVDAGVVFAVGAPMGSGPAAVAAMRSHGHTVHVITDRAQMGSPGVAEQSTRRWLDRHGYVLDSVTFSADKTAVATDIFIEDRDTNYLALDAAGAEPWLLDRPYNEHVPSARRVCSMACFAVVVALRAADLLPEPHACATETAPAGP